VVNGITIEPLSERLFDGVAALHRSTFRSHCTREHLAAKYDTSWVGVGTVATVAVADGRVVGFYGAIPQRFRREPHTFAGVHTCDSMVAAECRGRGLHGRMAREAYRLMSDRGVLLAYAYHSEATFRACEPLGWDVAMRLNTYRFPISTLPMSTLAFRHRTLERAYLRFWRRLIAPIRVDPPSMENSGRRTGSLHVDYSPEFFAYKRFSPNAIVTLAGTSVWIRAGRTLWVGDFDAPDQATAHRGLDGLVRLARRAGSHAVVFQVSPGSWTDDILSSRGTPGIGARVGTLKLGDPVDLANWNANFGDFDTF
jgi:GNAT superfamily N-acetyltransferase